MKKFILWIAFLGCISGCSKDDDPNAPGGEKTLSDYTASERVNKFVVDCTQTMYLWESATDWSQYQNYETYSNRAYQGTLTSHRALFYQFLNDDDDWSELTEDIETMKGEFDGIATTYGYKLIFGEFTNMDAYYGVVLYVVDGSPAEAAGIRRGDLIVGLNGAYITESNFFDLYYSSNISLTMGEYTDDGIGAKEGFVSMTAVEMYENPIQDFRIIEKGTHKIGYLCYTGYQERSEDELVAVFETFKAAQVTDIVLDLRYNGGGYASMAQLLSSMLAPASAVKNKEIYLKRHWNDLWMYIAGENNTEHFIDEVPVNMDLERLYVLTSAQTASASEATILSLDPYMDVILIGETTSGKYCGGMLLSPFDYYGMFPETGVTNNYLSAISNWGMYIMVYRYANKNNYPSFMTGIPPDYRIAEFYHALEPLGAETDPLLSVALEVITGEPAIVQRSAHEAPAHTLYPHMHIKRPTDGKMIYGGALPMRGH